MNRVRAHLDRLQKYAAAYFLVLYKTIFVFWKIPQVPTGGNILTGAFAIALVYWARLHLGRTIDSDTMAIVLGTAFFVLLLICGIAVIFDPKLGRGVAGARVQNMKRLVSVVCMGITLGCAFVVLDQIFHWISPLFGLLAGRDWPTESADRVIATVTALFASVVILANTVVHVGFKDFVLSIRNVVWSLVSFAIIAIGFNLVVAQSISF